MIWFIFRLFEQQMSLLWDCHFASCKDELSEYMAIQ